MHLKALKVEIRAPPAPQQPTWPGTNTTLHLQGPLPRLRFVIIAVSLPVQLMQNHPSSCRREGEGVMSGRVEKRNCFSCHGSAHRTTASGNLTKAASQPGYDSPSSLDCQCRRMSWIPPPHPSLSLASTPASAFAREK